MNSAAVVALLLGLVDSAASISAMLQKAKSENRDVTADELASLDLADALARKALVDAIAEAKARESA